MIDAAELARLKNKDWPLTGDETMSLIGALEKAQGENALGHAAFNYVEAQRDSARALLREAHERLAATSNHLLDHRLRARIAKELGDTP